jgi:hypothetical protein
VAQGGHQAQSCTVLFTRHDACCADQCCASHLLPLITPALRLRGVPYMACQGSVWLGRVTHCMLVAWICLLSALCHQARLGVGLVPHPLSYVVGEMLAEAGCSRAVA